VHRLLDDLKNLANTIEGAHLDRGVGNALRLDGEKRPESDGNSLKTCPSGA
jgi:hypothetical protein